MGVMSTKWQSRHYTLPSPNINIEKEKKQTETIRNNLVRTLKKLSKVYSKYANTKYNKVKIIQ